MKDKLRELMKYNQNERRNVLQNKASRYGEGKKFSQDSIFAGKINSFVQFLSDIKQGEYGN